MNINAFLGENNDKSNRKIKENRVDESSHVN